jgi:c-di-GMP-related signal transduction protein
MFERFIARQAILKDNLTLLGYDLQFRSQDTNGGATTSTAAFLINSATMVFHWESLTARLWHFRSGCPGIAQ